LQSGSAEPVPRFWLDADVLIQSKNGLYSFEIAPPFWSFLDEQVRIGNICSSTKIYDEILKREDKGDKLTLWAKNRKTSGMFAVPPRDVQKTYGQIADYTLEKYSQRRAKAAEFLSGGDGWIIAHAKCAGGTVVSHETRVDRSSLTPKIPNVCTQFGVPCIGLAEMLTKLNFKFEK
jgi:Domain of unknown function (DUF4411)